MMQDMPARMLAHEVILKTVIQQTKQQKQWLPEYSWKKTHKNYLHKHTHTQAYMK